MYEKYVRARKLLPPNLQQMLKCAPQAEGYQREKWNLYKYMNGTENPIKLK